MTEVNDELDHTKVVLIGTTGVSVWCEGRDYDPDYESYRPIYGYKIKNSDFEYVGNDIRGAVNELADTDKAMQSLLAFLYACQESYAHDIRNGGDGGEGENSKLFPPHVREWAHQMSEEISLAAVELEMANTITATPREPNLSVPDVTVDEGLHHCPECGEPCGASDYSDGRCKTCVRASCDHASITKQYCDDCGQRFVPGDDNN